MRFVPDRIFSSINEITPELLKNEEIKALVLDIDNTLAPRYVELPDEDLKKWIEGLKSVDVKLHIISNNRSNRVTKFSDALGVPFYCNGMKPFPRAFLRAVRQMDIPRGNVAAVGDQIYTDVAGAHLAGIRAWLVTPIDPHENIIFKIRRCLERPFIRKYYRNKKSGGGGK
ncbi:MAG TPA: YqeG family HAD IIIA-type phosphatase [Ruminiclostridium sp.]|nr:YqeG family HAD IIIA-type phosphatase [Ruminiclostridium sp.]